MAERGQWPKKWITSHRRENVFLIMILIALQIKFNLIRMNFVRKFYTDYRHNRSDFRQALSKMKDVLRFEIRYLN